MDIDEDNVNQRRILPDNMYSAGVTSDDVSMQVDTPFDGHQAVHSSSQGELIVHSHVIYS